MSNFFDELTVLFTTHNRPDLLRQALRTMRAYADPKCRVIILANRCEPHILAEVFQIAKETGVEVCKCESKAAAESIKNIVPTLKTEYFSFCHDDIGFVPGNKMFWDNLLLPLSCKTVAATGCTSNASDGFQHYQWTHGPDFVKVHNIHIPITVWKKDVYETLGGHDLSIPHSNDIDLCIRAHLAGLDLVVAKNSYVNHVGGASMDMMYGIGSKYLSVAWIKLMSEKTNNEIIRKHGVKVWADYSARSYEWEQVEIMHGPTYATRLKALERQPEAFEI